MRVKVLVIATIATIVEIEISDKDYAALDEEIMFETGGRYYSDNMAYALANSKDVVCRGTTEHSNETSYKLWRE